MKEPAVNDTDKLDLLLLVGGEELQKLLQTLPEQPTDYKSHIKMLWFKTEWSSDMYFADFETKCREQALHCDFPITNWTTQSS